MFLVLGLVERDFDGAVVMYVGTVEDCVSTGINVGGTVSTITGDGVLATGDWVCTGVNIGGTVSTMIGVGPGTIGDGNNVGESDG